MFQNIGIHAALILNKLRNEIALTNDAETNEVEHLVAGENQKAGRDHERGDEDGERANGAVVVRDRKRSSR